MVENLSLFEMEEQDQEQIRINRSGALDIVKMEFSGAESLSWQELFSGYDSLHAITYSSGISFVYRLLDLFTDAEIIFGCDEVISYSLQEIMAYQYKTIERMRETAGRMKLDLISRIEAETLRFYVARSVLSHEKIYLLSAKDGRKRVIMGSATRRTTVRKETNLSQRPFGSTPVTWMPSTPTNTCPGSWPMCWRASWGPWETGWDTCCSSCRWIKTSWEISWPLI